MIEIDINIPPPYSPLQRKSILEKIDKNKIEEMVERFRNEIKISLRALGINSFSPQNKNIANYIQLDSKSYARYYKEWGKIIFNPHIDKEQIREFINSVWDVRGENNQIVWYVIDYEIVDDTEATAEKFQTYINVFIKYKIRKR